CPLRLTRVPIYRKQKKGLGVSLCASSVRGLSSCAFGVRLCGIANMAIDPCKVGLDWEGDVLLGSRVHRAYGGEPNVYLLRSFLNLGRTGDWLTLSNRGSADVPIALVKPITYLVNWKGSFFYVENRIIPSYYPELLLEKMDFRSFMIQEIDSEFKFLSEGCIYDNQGSPSSKSVNNEAPVIDTKPLTSLHPSNSVEDVADSDDASVRDNENPLLGTSMPPLPEAGKKLRSLAKRKLPSGVGDSLPKVQKMAAQASKVAGEASDPLDVDSDADIHEFPSAKELKDSADCHWVVAYVTPPSWKEHLRQTSIKQLCDIHDRAYIRQVVLDNVLNSRTRELIYALHKATTSYDAIRARELKKLRAYAELERKCNEALLDLNKNPLVVDMRTEIETLQGRVDRYHSLKSERERLKLSEIQLLQEMDVLKQDRASVVAKVVPDATTKLIHSDEMGMFAAKLLKASIIYGRCAYFEEVAKLKEPLVMEKMVGYRPSSKQEYDQAGDDLANAKRSYPFFCLSMSMTPIHFVTTVVKETGVFAFKAFVFDFEGLMCGPSSPLRRFILLDNVFDFEGLMCGPSSPLRRFILLDNVFDFEGLMHGPSSPLRHFILLDNMKS
ncbi:hypothetical protein Tco_1072615, partial [Tanacetum coccineum]